jgi:arylsulfatase A-like enzyme
LLAALASACGHGGDDADASARRASAGPRPVNVLLLVADTLRANRLGCYGYTRPTSPHIDRLASEGTLYLQTYSQACWTVPSMISMMSGVSVTLEETVLPAQYAVLGETLHAQGLETAAFLANATLTTDRGFERGFDVLPALGNVDAVTLAKAFEDWHRARKPERPFFAWVQFIDPHQPYAPDPEHNVFSGPRPDQEALVERWRAALPRVAELSPSVAPLPFDVSVEKMIEQSNLYDGEVLAVDDGVGRILDALRASGELERTLVLFCADHGEMLFEHGIQPFLVRDRLQRFGGLPEGVKDLFGNGHRPWYFEDLWHTPLIIAGPGMPAGKRIGGLAANLDLYPTVLEALDFPSLSWLQGESLFGGREPSRELVFAHGQLTSAARDRSGRKLIVHPRRLYLLEGEGPAPVELYDLAQDPLEDHDLAAARPEEVARLRSQIERWHSENDRAAITTTSPEQQKGLIQMGYVGDGEGGHADSKPAPPAAGSGKNPR